LLSGRNMEGVKSGQRKFGRVRQGNARAQGGSPKRWGSGTNTQPAQHTHDARRNYERYMVLARAEAASGNVIGAENYYQHAEHYYRLMSAGPGAGE
jgi:hypothetical protein